MSKLVRLGRYYENFLKIGRITSKNEFMLKYITEMALKEGRRIEREENTLMLVGKDPWTIQDKVKEIFEKDKKILKNRQELTMDYDKIKLMSQDDRDRILKSELDEDKIMFINKYGLKCNEDLIWEIPKGNYPQRPICKHFLLKKWDMIQTIFYMNRLCYGKIKYFTANWSEFAPYKHDWKQGFIECPLWDMEFIKHKKTGNMVDLRWLKGITDIDVFRQWCKDFTEKE